MVDSKLPYMQQWSMTKRGNIALMDVYTSTMGKRRQMLGFGKKIFFAQSIAKPQLHMRFLKE